jgi:hypothetical protein
MILKIHDSLTNCWWLVDSVVRCSTGHLDDIEVVKSYMKASDYILFDSSNLSPYCKYILFHVKHDDHRQYLAMFDGNVPAFILNDEGKTIERL